MQAEFDLWLEFEDFDPVGTSEPYFHMEIQLKDGRRYALNVWVASAIEEILSEAQEIGMGLGGEYSVGPDLIVRRHDRAFLEAVVRDLIESEQLKEEWRVPPDKEWLVSPDLEGSGEDK